MGAMDLSFSEINGASSLLSVEPTTANHVPINLGNSALLYSTLRNSVENNQVATSSSSSGSSALSSGSGADGSRTVQVGSEHQVTIPQLMPPHTLQQYIEDTVDLSMPVWSAYSHNLTDQQIDDFVKSSGDLKDSISHDSVSEESKSLLELKSSSEDLKQSIFSEEQCLTVLCFNNFNLTKAKEELKHLRPVDGNYNGCGSRWWWCENDRISFENAFKLHGKHFVRLQEAVPHKSVGQVVDYYYRWKRQPIHSTVMDLYLERQRQQKQDKEEKGGKQEAEEFTQNNNTTSSSKDKTLSWWFDSEDDEFLIALKRRKLDQQQQEVHQESSQSSKDSKKSLGGTAMFDLSTNKRILLKRKVTDLIHLDGDDDEDNDENDRNKKDNQGKETKAGIKRSCKEIERVTLNDDEDETSSASTATANGANAATNGPNATSSTSSSASSTTSTSANNVSQSSNDGMRLNTQQLCHLVEVSRDWEQYRRRLNGKTVALQKHLQQLKQNTNWEVLNSYQRDLSHLRSSRKCAKLMYLLSDQQKRPKSVNWSSSEEEMFLLCARRYGIKDLEVLSVLIGTKSVSQVKNFIPVAKIKHRLDHLLDPERLTRNATNPKSTTRSIAESSQTSKSSMEQTAVNSRDNGAMNSFDLRLRPLEADRTIRDFIANTANFISSHPEGIALTTEGSVAALQNTAHSGQNGCVSRRQTPNSVPFPSISATQTTATALPHISRTTPNSDQGLARPTLSRVHGQPGSSQTTGTNGNRISLQRHLLAHAAMLSQKQNQLQQNQRTNQNSRNDQTISSQQNSTFQISQARDRTSDLSSARTESSSSQSRPSLFTGSVNSVCSGDNGNNSSFSGDLNLTVINNSPQNLFSNGHQPMLHLMQQQQRRSGLDLSSALSHNRGIISADGTGQPQHLSSGLSTNATTGGDGDDDDDDIVEVFPNK